MYLPTDSLTKFLSFEQDWMAPNTRKDCDVNPICRGHFHFLCGLKQGVVTPSKINLSASEIWR